MLIIDLSHEEAERMVVELLQGNKSAKQLTTVPVTQVDIFKTSGDISSCFCGEIGLSPSDVILATKTVTLSKTFFSLLFYFILWVNLTRA